MRFDCYQGSGICQSLGTGCGGWEENGIRDRDVRSSECGIAVNAGSGPPHPPPLPSSRPCFLPLLFSIVARVTSFHATKSRRFLLDKKLMIPFSLFSQTVFNNFFHGQMYFHAKALELYTTAIQNLVSMDEGQDIEVI